MEKNIPQKNPTDTGAPEKVKEEKIEKEFDADDETHKTKPDLIQKQSHRIEVDDEVKKG